MLGIDLPPLLICQLTLDTAWITDDEAWRSLLNKEGVHPGDKRYMESIREGVQQMRAGGAGNGGGGGGGGGSGGGGGGGVGSIARENGWMWLFSVRDNKVGPGLIIGKVIKLMSSDRVSYCKWDTESDRDVEKLMIFVPHFSKISGLLAIHSSLM